MFQGIYENRCAWRNDPPTGTPKIWTWGNGYSPIDFEGRVGYAYGGASGTQSTAATGGGDFFGEGSVGVPLITFVTGTPNSGKVLQTLGPEVFATFSSDSQYAQVHAAYGVGLSYVAGIPLTANDGAGQNIQLMLRAGYAAVDSPSIVGGTTNGPLVGVNGDGTPRFITMGAADITAEMRFPITISSKEFGCLSVGGTAYAFPAKNEPDQWSLYVALSISINQIINAL
jgi:hypothetical protein